MHPSWLENERNRLSRKYGDKMSADDMASYFRGAERDFRRDAELTAQLKEWRALMSRAQAAGDDVMEQSKLITEAALLERKLKKAFSDFVQLRADNRRSYGASNRNTDRSAAG